MQDAVTCLEGATHPRLHLVLAVLDDLADKLGAIGSGREYQDRHGYVRRPSATLETLAGLYGKCLRCVRIHPLYVAGALLHPHPNVNSLLFLNKAAKGTPKPTRN